MRRCEASGTGRGSSLVVAGDRDHRGAAVDGVLPPLPVPAAAVPVAPRPRVPWPDLAVVVPGTHARDEELPVLRRPPARQPVTASSEPAVRMSLPELLPGSNASRLRAGPSLTATCASSWRRWPRRTRPRSQSRCRIHQSPCAKLMGQKGPSRTELKTPRFPATRTVVLLPGHALMISDGRSDHCRHAPGGNAVDVVIAVEPQCDEEAVGWTAAQGEVAVGL